MVKGSRVPCSADLQLDTILVSAQPSQNACPSHTCACACTHQLAP